MLKNIFIILGSVLVVVAGILLSLPQTSPFRKESVSIAVVAPLSGPARSSGLEMLNGINLYLETLRKTGDVLPGKKIELRIFDDHGDPQRAKAIASQIVAEKKALLVLGHYYSSSSIPAGKIYQQDEVVAITASATAEAVTSNNEWYFRVVPNNDFQGGFLAHYIYSTLHQDSVSLVYVNDSYGASLAESFQQTAERVGMSVQKIWRFRLSDEYLENQLDQIVRELSMVDDPGAICLVTYTAEAAKILASLASSAERSYSFVIPELSLTALIDALKAESAPESLVNGIYTTSPFILELGNEQTHAFGQAYERKYREKPGWIAAGYYDAMHVAIEAMKHAKIQGKGHLRSDRRKIQQALAGMFSREQAIKGVTGYIYFDPQGDVNKPYAVGVVENETLFPAFSQYQEVVDTSALGNIFEKALKGEIVVIDDLIMKKVQMVYTGIDVRAISSIDAKNSTYTLDFYLWFRFPGEFDDSEIEFTNAITPISPGQPLLEETIEGVTTRIYHIHGDFSSEFDFHTYPFEPHRLSIRFRHATQTSDRLILVEDLLEHPRFVKEKSGGTTIAIDPDWVATDILRYQDIVTNISTLGNPRFFESPQTLNYSRFNAAILVKRKNTLFALKQLAPFLTAIVLLGIMSGLPSNWLGIRLAGMMMALLITAAFHNAFMLAFPAVEYITIFEYVVFGLYGVMIFSIFSTISIYGFYRKKLALLQHIAILQPFPEKIKSSLSKKMKKYHIKKPGETIIRQGDQGNSLFVIIKGEVSIVLELDDGTSLELNRIRAGSYFGEMAFLTGEPRSANVVSAKPSILCELSRDHVAPFLKKHPDLIEMMTKELTRRKIVELQKTGEQEIDEAVFFQQHFCQINEFLGQARQDSTQKT